MSEVIPAIINVECPACGVHDDITVNWLDHQSWAEDGVDIDVALAALSVWERRMLEGGLCESCWVIFNG